MEKTSLECETSFVRNELHQMWASYGSAISACRRETSLLSRLLQKDARRNADGF